jgi:hypothetical protein
MNTIKNSAIIRLRDAARPFGIFIAVVDSDSESDLVCLEAASTYNNRPDFVDNHESDTRVRWAAFFDSCSAQQQGWLNGEFRFEKTARHMDRRYVSGEFQNVRG